MFRALTCPSSGGQNVLSQHLVLSLSVQPFNSFTKYGQSTSVPVHPVNRVLIFT